MLPLPYAELLEQVRAAVPSDIPIYLVGGAVRDMLIGRPTHDLDFVLPRKAIASARRVADKLQGAFYPLDSERDTGRVLLPQTDGSSLCMDFAAFRGATLQADLADRDFTLNAIALDLQALQTLIDPLGGAQDLQRKQLRACSPQSIENDPLRILRAVRQSIDLGLQIEPETRRLLRAAAPLLPRVSAERIRDELFKMLEGSRPATALRVLDHLGALALVLPEVSALQGIQQSAPHSEDVWNHTLALLERLNGILAALRREHNQELAANWALGLLSVQLGRYRTQLEAHLAEQLNPQRSLRGLLLLAGLYHDSGKALTGSVDETGRIRFFQHEEESARLAHARATALRLSGDEVERLERIVAGHMRPHLLSNSGDALTRRAIYRFFRATGPAGVDICLLALADLQATYGAALPQEVWQHELGIIRQLLEAWWEAPETQVAPPALLSGNDLMQLLDLPPGKRIGELLEALREAQATGEINSREAALEYARSRLVE